MGKLYDVVCTIGTYQKDGQNKYVTRNVGSVIETQHGLSLKLDASFNPAGCIKSEDGSVWLKLFEPKENRAPDAAHQAHAKGMQQAPNKQPPAGFNDFDDDLSF